MEKIVDAYGNSKMDIQRIARQKIIDLKSWGKHFLICFEDFTVRIHFMLFGSYRINEWKETKLRLSVQFGDGEINVSACSLQFIEGDIISAPLLPLPHRVEDGLRPVARKRQIHAWLHALDDGTLVQERQVEVIDVVADD